MALSLTSANSVRQKALREIRRPGVDVILRELFSFLAQHRNSPDLQFVPFAALSDSETVIADAPCKAYALFTSVLSTSDAATFVKMTDHATTSSDAASEFRFKIGGVGAEEEVFVWPRGKAFANGITMQGNTTANGGTASDAADGASGFAIVGAP